MRTFPSPRTGRPGHERDGGWRARGRASANRKRLRSISRVFQSICGAFGRQELLSRRRADTNWTRSPRVPSSRYSVCIAANHSLHVRDGRNGSPTIHDASRFRIVAMRCCTGAPTSSQARGEPFDVPQGDHQASSRNERHFQDAVPLVRTPDQRVRASSRPNTSRALRAALTAFFESLRPAFPLAECP